MSKAQLSPAIIAKIRRRIKIARDKTHPKREEAGKAAKTLLKEHGLTVKQFEAQVADFKGELEKVGEGLSRQETSMKKHFGSQPPLALSYGESKVGKSAEGMATHPGALFVVGKGHLKACRNLYDYAPENYLYPPNGRSTTLETLNKALRGRMRREKHTAIVVEELTMLARNQVEKLEDDGFTGWDPWIELKRVWIGTLELARRRNCAFYGTAHPRTINEDKDFLVGAAHIGSYAVSRETPRYMDLVLHAAYSESEFMPQHPYAYHHGDPNWVTGDRHAIMPLGESPMNLAELYHHGGLNLPYPDEIRWIQEAAEKGFGMLKEGKSLEDLGQKFWNIYHKRQGKSTPRVLWALRNARDRYWFYKNSLNQQRLSQFGLGRSDL